jgi:nucleoside-diphosphate-sugar epimerase
MADGLRKDHPDSNSRTLCKEEVLGRMKVLFIGGTGLISSACAALAVERGFELYLLNRGSARHFPPPPGAIVLQGDIRNDPSGAAALLQGHRFDAVVDWIAFTPDHIEQDIELFAGKTRQLLFISSASAYQKPPTHYRITEDTPLANPFWDYSRNKIACEERLMQVYRETGFPITIVRPSLTYGPSQIPLCPGSWNHPYTLVDRMRRGEPVIVPGDGTSLWTMTWNGDFAKGLVGLLGRETTLGHAFHITSDEVLTWNQIFTEVAHAVGVEPKLVHIPSDLLIAYNPGLEGTLLGDKVNSVAFDNSKIKRFVPDFVASVPWSEGVRRALAWFEADPARQTIDETANAQWDEMITAYRRAFP